MDAVKFVKGDDSLIEGLAIPYGGPFKGRDLDAEKFEPTTDFCLDWFDVRPTLYDHGTDPSTKAEVVGRVVHHEPTDAGIWAKTQLDKSHRYHAKIRELVDQGRLFFSSGAMPHLVDTDRKTGAIKRWPWVELSLTPTPANPDAAVYGVKAVDFLQHMATITDVPGPVEAAIKALDEWADTNPGLGSGPVAEHGQRVLADLTGFVERLRERSEVRAKAGRELSGSNRELLDAFLGQLDAVDEVRRQLKELLTRTDPEAGKAALSVLADFEKLNAQMVGVPIRSTPDASLPAARNGAA